MSVIRETISNNMSKQGRYMNKHSHFVEIYEDLLAPYVGTEAHLVELGINHGGSLQMFRDYLGDKACIYGLDRAEHCLFEEPGIKCFLIDQSSASDLDKIASLIPKIDIFIDDGSHYSRDQIATFEKVFPLITPGGIYVCEDIHTSYRVLYDGDYKHPNSFVEYCKNIIDSMHKAESELIKPNIHISSISSIQLYYAMAIIRKL